jgi:DNA-binding transcriptional LysR family regulator
MVLIGYARRFLDLNEEALAAVSGERVDGVVRLGAPVDLAETWLPPVLARFAGAHPRTKVDVLAARVQALRQALGHGRLDMALMFSDQPPVGDARAAAIPMAWIGTRDFVRREGEPVRLAVLDSPCIFRATATAALDDAGIAWTIAYSSQNLAGLWAAVASGLGITLRTPIGMPPLLAVLPPESGLPPKAACRRRRP